MGRWLAAFGRWRRSRPFWGGVSVLTGAIIILSIPLGGASLGVVFTEGIAGISGVLIALMMAVAGLTLWVSPSARVFAGIAACFLSIVAVVTSNLGGFLFGTIFGVVGGAMGVAWSPDEVVKTPKGHKHVKVDRDARPVLVGVGVGKRATPPSDPQWSSGRREDGGISRLLAIAAALIALIVTPLAATASAHSPSSKPNDLISQVFATAKNPTTISASYNQTGGTDYEGVGTYDGKTVLKFRFDSDDIENMDMRSNNDDPSAPDVDITATKAHLSGNMEFYATSLSGSLFGLIPSTFTPTNPPPITLPTLILTNFSASVVFIKVDDMQLQGLNLTVLPPGT